MTLPPTPPLPPAIPEPVPAMGTMGTAPPADMRLTVRQARGAAKALRSFVRSHPEQVVDKKYLCVESMQFLGALLGCTAIIAKTEEFSDLQDVQGFIAVAHVRDAGGQVLSGGEAACMRNEPDWSDRPSFQLRSMAQTRAIAKAFRNLFAWVVVMAGFQPTPAEEIRRGPTEHSPMTGKKCDSCGNQLSDKRWRDTRKKFGKALCMEHERVEQQSRDGLLMEPIKDAAFVADSVKRVQENLATKKASQGQPIVELLDRKKDAWSL